MTPADIITSALQVTGVTREQLFSRQRTRQVSDCRKHIAHLLYRNTGATLDDVAGHMGGISTGAAGFQVHQAAHLYRTDPRFRRQHDAIVETLLDKKAVA